MASHGITWLCGYNYTGYSPFPVYYCAPGMGIARQHGQSS